MPARVVPQVEVVEVSLEDGREKLDQRTKDRLGIGVDEFLRRLDAGEYMSTDDEDVLRLVMLAPFAR